MKLEQIAIATNDTNKTIQALSSAFGLAGGWTMDVVEAKATVFGQEGENIAELNFNYDLGFELEVLEYINGASWHDARVAQGAEFPFLSHIGYHCTEREAQAQIARMALLGVNIAQEVHTKSHSNPVIDGKRLYHYVVFDSKHLLGFDLKLIVRLNPDGSEYVEGCDA